MAASNVNFPAAQGSDIVTVQLDTNPSGATTPVTVTGYVVDIGGYASSLSVTNTQVGEFTGKR